uniref:G-protein coupled receptors family 1 profile domain-containing protein n=1 Tax=Neogobius melanostomus TaxID=47308 RepID=A0A8C6U1T3_9GOBI
KKMTLNLFFAGGVDMEAVALWVSVVLYIITVTVGISGNSMVIYVSAFKIKTNVTNVFLVNLAVADLIFCVSRIFYLVYLLRSNDWPYGSFLCKFGALLKYGNMFCSVFLLAVISLDRALCVWRPLLIKTKRTPFVARAVAVAVWTLAITLSVPYYMYRHVYPDKNNRTECSIDVGNTESAKSYLYWLRFVCGFALPFVVILVCYISAGFGIKRTNLSKKSRSLRILVILVIAFFLCWAPYHILQLFKMADKNSKKLKPWQRITSAIAYFNSCVNPLLYYCLGVRLRGGFRQRLTTVYSRAIAAVMEEEPNHEDTTRSQAFRGL